MSTTITLYTNNILYTGTVTAVSTCANSANYPVSRLYDGDILTYFKSTSTGVNSATITIDQGTSGKYVDTIIIPKHNFSDSTDNGTLTLAYSTDGSSWTTGKEWTQTDNNLISQSLTTGGTTAVYRYWRLQLGESTSPIPKPRCSEIVLSKGYTWEVLGEPNPMHGDIDNVNHQRLLGGGERSVKRSTSKRYREYTVFLNSTQQTDFASAMSDLDNYSKFFFIKDHNDDYIFVDLDVPTIEYDHPTYAHIRLSLLEV